MYTFAQKLACGFAVIAALVIAPLLTTTLMPTPAFAETSEKDAFEAAKELGTVDAWNAFLASYPSGFHADLARAYLKKLGTERQQAARPSPFDDFPVVAGSWGGIVRDGPGEEHKKVASLDEGEEVTLMARTDVMKDGFPWFKIAYGDDQRGYQWGGILCAVGDERPDVFKTCPTKKAKSAKREDDDEREDRSERKRGCSNGRVMVDGKCMKERAAAGYCGPGYRAQGGKCVQGYKAPSANAPPTKEQKKAVNKGCPRGQVWNAQEGCHEDD
jgi:hypothetical protein